MATTLTSTLTAKILATYVNDLDLNDPSVTLNYDFSDTLANGTGKDQADILWFDQRVLAGTSEDLDLAGSLTNAFGTTVTFVKIKGIIIKNVTTTATYTLTVGGAAANQFINWVSDASDEIVIGPDGFIWLHNPSAAGYGVTAATGDLLKIDSGANTVTYDIILYGTSA